MSQTSPNFKFTIFGIVASVFMVLMFNVQPTTAGLVVSENFDSYSSGTSLAGLNGGTGFAGAWTGSGFSVVDNGSGNSASGLSFSGNFRNLGTDTTSIFSSSMGEIWVSFDFRTSNVDNDFAGLNFYQGTTERVLIGKQSFTAGTDNNSNWMISRDAGDGDISNVSFSTMKTGVVRFNLGSGNLGSADLWVGSDVGPVDISGAPDASMGGMTLSGIDRIALRGSVASTIDSIKIGTTSFDVNSVPEPTSFTLFGIGVFGLAVRRRSRR